MFSTNINNECVDVYVHYESRNNARVSIGKKGIYIRLPLYIGDKRAKEFVLNSINWAENKLKNKQHFTPKKFKTYKQGERLTFYDNSEIQVFFRKMPSVKNKVECSNGKLMIELNQSIKQSQMEETIAKLCRKTIAKQFQPRIEKRLHKINDYYKIGQLNRVVLRNSVTNWGSCNHRKGYINVSLRLLLAPKFVVDAVLVHELCHLVHANHSKTFWRMVYKIYPEYRKANTWLKENGHKCYL